MDKHRSYAIITTHCSNDDDRPSTSPPPGCKDCVAVATNAKSIRAERYAEIGTIIQRDTTLLIEQWSKRAVEEQPNARRVHHQDLLDDLPRLLWELGGHLTSEGETDGSPHRRFALEHGEHRWQTGWSLTEVIRDYRILRLVVLEHLDEVLDRSLRLREIQAVGLALDEAIEASVRRYVQVSETQYRELAESLREADRRKNDFLATLAHELRNPLAPLRNTLEVIRLQDDSPAAIRQARELMDRQVEQMTRLVEDLLDVTRIAQAKLVLHKEHVELGAAVECAVQMSTPMRTARGHQLEVGSLPAPVWIEADQARVVQVMVNLLNNAARYTPDGGIIAISAAQDGKEAVIRVKDNGIGIPKEKLASIFDMYTQLDHRPIDSQGGLGIGLTLVRHLVELQGGTVVAESAGPDRGSEFIVRFPAVSEKPKSPPPPARGPAAAGRHVLIVEDNRDGRESLAVLLDLLGHRVSVAGDGQSGLDAALALCPEIALIDIGLPGLDGYEVARRIRADLGDSVLLIAVTGFGQPEDLRRAIEAGFNSHLLKPVDLASLEQTLADHRPPAV
jgi:signal transduction histidine kinase/CheY-like chemotaxis protein